MKNEECKRCAQTMNAKKDNMNFEKYEMNCVCLSLNLNNDQQYLT